jgi:hypothetical protein
VIFCMAYHACRIVKGRWRDLWAQLGVNEDAGLSKLTSQNPGAHALLRLLSFMHHWPAPAGFDWSRLSAVFNASFSATERIRAMQTWAPSCTRLLASKILNAVQGRIGRDLPMHPADAVLNMSPNPRRVERVDTTEDVLDVPVECSWYGYEVADVFPSHSPRTERRGHRGPSALAQRCSSVSRTKGARVDIRGQYPADQAGYYGRAAVLDSPTVVSGGKFVRCR